MLIGVIVIVLVLPSYATAQEVTSAIIEATLTLVLETTEPITLETTEPLVLESTIEGETSSVETTQSLVLRSPNLGQSRKLFLPRLLLDQVVHPLEARLHSHKVAVMEVYPQEQKPA